MRDIFSVLQETVDKDKFTAKKGGKGGAFAEKDIDKFHADGFVPVKVIARD